MRSFDPSPAAAARRGSELARQLESWLDGELAEAAAARAPWHHDFSSVEGYLASVEPSRRRLCALYGLDRPPAPTGTAPVVEPIGRLGAYLVEQLRWQPWPPLTCDALLARPDDAARPAVIALHGLSGSPEQFLGLSGPSSTAALTARLLDAGLVLIAPRLASGWRARLRLARKSRLLGREWVGAEVNALRRLLDVLPGLRGVDPSAIGVYGFSRGGQDALLLAACDERLAAVGLASWFCDRTTKLLGAGDGEFVSFIDSPEEEQFAHGLLPEFTDPAIASLVAPDPLLITSGLDDPVIPFEHVEHAVEPLRECYEALGLDELFEVVLFPGGHEPATDATVGFFTRFLEPPPLKVPTGWLPVTDFAPPLARRASRRGLTAAEIHRRRRLGRRRRRR